MDPQQVAASKAAAFVAKFNEIILFPTIILLMAVAFLVFLWGTAQYFIQASNEQARQQAAKHMMWGVIGLVVMTSAFVILTIAANTFGLSSEVQCADDPSGPGCAGVFKVGG